MTDERSLREKIENVKEIGCLMGLRVEQVLSMTPNEFGYEYEGWKLREERENRRVARICAVLANINRDPKKRPTPFSEDDFMPEEKQAKKQTNEEMFNMVLALNKAYGGTGGV